MNDYQAPLRDIEFSMNEVLGFEEHYRSLVGDETASPDLIRAVTTEFAKFCETVLVPLYRVADEEGCTWTDGQVTTPPGFKEAYQQYIEAGWPSLPCSTEYGGQGLPTSLAKIIGEVTGSANISFALYTGGLSGAIETLSVFGTPEQRDTYERKLIEGVWNATMCLTEPHCGTDLGLINTKAVPTDDGSYAITGTKIFITGGEHDLTENIIHLVLARLPNAPKGNKGISLFIVPKVLPNGGGSEATANGVTCGSIEKKMGIKGSATCVMQFDGARGFLLGEPNRGLNAMFTFINASRIKAGFQGLSHTELGFQKSLGYARERLQMRSLTGPKNLVGPADPIIVHPDVRRMLMTQKVFAEGNRVMLHYLAKQLDIAEKSTDPEARETAERRLDLMTPIAKGFVTETGFESTNLALQCFGGHGYIREWGVEQNVRDSRIAMLYEGTTGIQGLDLIGRKVLASGGALLDEFCEEILLFCRGQNKRNNQSDLLTDLERLVDEWRELTATISTRATENADEVGAASVNYLMYSGYVCLAYFWALSAVTAEQRPLASADDADFYKSKIASANFYYQHVLPRTRSSAAVIKNGAGTMMALDEKHFAF